MLFGYDILLMTELSLRQIKPTDGKSLQTLFAYSPDTGRFAISPEYQIDPYTAFISLSPGMVGVVAEIVKTGQIIGAGLVNIEERFLAGKPVSCALLHSLHVHPKFRRQGIAARLAQWRIEYARTQVGEDVVILAGIQNGNAGSLAAAQKWSNQIVGEYYNILMPVRSKPPVNTLGIAVREAKAQEYSRIAHNLNDFYQDYNLSARQTTHSLTDWLCRTPFERPFRHYFVAVDQQDNLLAGMAVAEQFRVVSMCVQHMPSPVRLLNRVVKMVPPDGVLYQSNVNYIWYAPDQLVAAQFLWQSIRWKLREIGTHIVCSYDARGPIPSIISPPFWLPKGSSIIVARTELPIDNRLISQL